MLRTLFLLLAYVTIVFSLRIGYRSLDPCERTNSPDPRTLRSDQVTVLINGYSESRIPLLTSIAATYSASATVSFVLVLWGNPSTPTPTVAQLSRNLSDFSTTAPISLVRQTSLSLNSRFLPLKSISTRAVLICDDDVEVNPKSIDFAFRIWKANQDRLVGFFARSHDFDLERKSWIYTVHPDKYSILLTKFMIMNHEYLYQYTCEGGESMEEMRSVVDRMHNCEDILMNFLVADSIGHGPILVQAERLRDWGDARNEAEEKGVKEVGLSSRKGEHRKRRGECIAALHRISGRMPLRYSFGKVVDSVGEQGLCEKGGKLVFCDQQTLK